VVRFLFEGLWAYFLGFDPFYSFSYLDEIFPGPCFFVGVSRKEGYEPFSKLRMGTEVLVGLYGPANGYSSDEIFIFL